MAFVAFGSDTFLSRSSTSHPHGLQLASTWFHSILVMLLSTTTSTRSSAKQEQETENEVVMARVPLPTQTLRTSSSSSSSSAKALRVVSLLPSATENFTALVEFAQRPSRPQPSNGLLPTLVGRSHECDYPTTSDVQQLPVLTAPRTAFTTSADVHKQVREALADASSLYRLDTERLVALQPDVILTQSTCRVCSIDLATVEQTVGAATSNSAGCSSGANVEDRGEIPEIPGKTTRIVTCNPISLVEAVVTQFEQLGREVGLPEDGQAMASQHRERLRALEALARERVQAIEQRGGVAPRVLLVEWLEPLFIGKMGWMREIIESAGGQVVESLSSVSSKEEQDGLPPIDVVIVALCGLSIEKTEHEIALGNVGGWWRDVLQAHPKVYLVDGTAMFTRPTPRLLLALEWLVHVLHRDVAAEADAWVQASTFPFKQVDVVAELAAFARKSQSAADKRKQEELAEIEELHRVACQNQQAMYTDPATGYSVMTAYHLSKSQVCCGNGCRHCPYGHVNVSDPARRKNRLTDSVVLQPKRRGGASRQGGELLWPSDRANRHLDNAAPSERDLVVMFWSGGKDSLLALTTLYAQYAADPSTPMPQVVLLTTIDPESHTVPIQGIPDRVIAQQAEALGLPLCLVGVGLGDDYVPQIQRALAELPARVGAPRRRRRTASTADADALPAIKALVFGDLHLDDIRAWRIETFGRDYELRFPVWQQDYETVLLPRLHDLMARTGTRIVFSTVQSAALEKHGVRVGDAFDSASLQSLNSSIGDVAEGAEAALIDLMGERGEFHTCVVFPGMEAPASS